MRGKECKEDGVEKYPMCRLQQTNERDRDGEISRGSSDFSGVIFLMRVGKMEEGPWYCFRMRKTKRSKGEHWWWWEGNQPNRIT